MLVWASRAGSGRGERSPEGLRPHEVGCDRRELCAAYEPAGLRSGQRKPEGYQSFQIPEHLNIQFAETF